MSGAEENVVIESGDCSVLFMPALGGKIASILVLGHELLQAPLNAYGARTRDMGFAEGDASGWDECLPSVAACHVETEAGMAAIPDHGDLWRVPWQVLERQGDATTMRANCYSLPLQLTRSAILSETAEGWELQLFYSVTNMGAYVVPWSWSAHPLFAVEVGDRILLPDQVETLRLEGSAGNRLGVGGETISWPLAEVGGGTTTDLTLVKAADAGTGDKLFAGASEAITEGWCELERVGIGLRLRVEFDPRLTPFLGLWLCFGGWPAGEGAKQVCVAIEPATAPVDSLATVGPWSRILEVGETVSWPMTLKIERISIA